MAGTFLTDPLDVPLVVILEVMAEYPAFVEAFTAVSGGLTRDRLAHVDQHYLRPENYAAANTVLIEAQATIPLAQLWGGGLVAAVDGMRFVVPVRTADARANLKWGDDLTRSKPHAHAEHPIEDLSAAPGPLRPARRSVGRWPSPALRFPAARQRAVPAATTRANAEMAILVAAVGMGGVFTPRPVTRREQNGRIISSTMMLL